MAKNRESPRGRSRDFDPVGTFDSTAPWRRGLMVAVLLIVLLCVLLPEIIFQNKIFMVPDTQAPLSFATVGKKALEEGIYPLWNPYLFCGMPSYSSVSYTPYVYPPSYVAFLLHKIGFPEMIWLLLHLWLAGIGMYLLLRSFAVRGSVSLLAAMIFIIMPNYLATAANGHGSQACAVAYMPWAFLFIRNIMLGKNRFRNSALLAITLGFQMLRGHIQISYYTYLIMGAVFLLESGYHYRAGRKREILLNLGCVIGVFVLALGIAAVLVFPVREYAAYSIRGGGGGSGGGVDYGYATSWSLHPRELMTFIFPWAAGYGKATYWGEMPFTDYPNYLGIGTFIFSVMALFLVRNRWKWFLFVIAALSTGISFGRFFPLLYDLLFKFLPYFNKFRVPVMILIVQQLSTVVLMGLGLEAYLRLHSQDGLPRLLRPDRMKWILAAVGIIFALVLVFQGSVRDGLLQNPTVGRKVNQQWINLAADAYAKDLVRTLFFLVAVGAVLYLASLRKIPSSVMMISLAAIALIDLYTVDVGVVNPQKVWNTENVRIIKSKGDREVFSKPTPAMEFLKKDDSLFRIFPVPAAQPGRWGLSLFPFSDNSYMMSGIFSIGGYHAAKLQNYQNLMELMFQRVNQGSFPHQILDMLAVKYFVSIYPLFKDNSPYPLVYQGDRAYIYENPGALPRFFFVDKFRVINKEHALGELVSPAFDPRREVLLEKRPPGRVESASGSTVEIVDYKLNSFDLKVRVEKPCLLVLSEIFYPHWRARVDGREMEILKADYCLRALSLPAGEHEVTFRFYSPVLRVSLIASLISFILAILVAVLIDPIINRRGK
ncbi:MAG: YfhO family protein [Candidatus Krumholzibacteriota bacterium]|nr:YfhO family protein [Candidatus Krumholzibacteriota bacterium]